MPEDHESYGDPELPMYYAELPPSSALVPWIASHWHFRVAAEASAIEHTVPLTGGAMLVVSRGREPIVAGPRLAPLRTTVHGGDVVWGTHVWPGAAGTLLRCPGAKLRDAMLPVRVLVGDAAADALARTLDAVDDETTACRALDAWFETLAGGADPLDELAMTAVFRIVRSGGRVAVTDLARSLAISPRQLRRRVRAATGLTPKELLRVRRVRTSLIDTVREPSSAWVDIAAEHGYADQAHLVREYRSVLGLTPRRFDRHAKRIRHRGVSDR